MLKQPYTSSVLAVSGDSLLFSIPVINRGVQTSPPSIIEIQAPDGSTVNGQVPIIRNVHWCFNWTITSSQEFGNISLIFELVRIHTSRYLKSEILAPITEEYSLVTSTLPLANLSIPSTIAQDEILIDGTDKLPIQIKTLICDFTIVADYGLSVFEEFNSEEIDCALEWAPMDARYYFDFSEL